MFVEQDGRCIAGGGGAYTSAEGAALRVAGFVRPNSTVVDIGGHLGRFSEAIIALGALPLTTLIFEPVRVLHLCQIQRLGNVSNNFGSPQYNFFNFALGNVDNKVESIKTAPGEWTSSALPPGWNTLTETDPGLDAMDSDMPDWRDKMGRETILVRKFATVLEELSPHLYKDVSVIKIDTEGYEGEVLRGALPFLRRVANDANRTLPVMVIETAWGVDRHPDKEENMKTYREVVRLGYCNTHMVRDHTTDVLWVPVEVDPSCSKYKILEGGRL
eukprot:g7215.t1